MGPYGSALLGDLFYSFLCPFHVLTYQFFWTSWIKIQHCYIGESISPAVVQQRTLLLGFFFWHLVLVWCRMKVAPFKCFRLVHFHPPCRWGTCENGLWNACWLQLLLTPDCSCSWELAGIASICNKMFVAIRVKFWVCKTIVLYNFMLFFCNSSHLLTTKD